MKKSLKKRGQKFFRKFSVVSAKASEEGKEHIKENLIGRFSHIQDIKLLILEWGLLVLALILLATAQSVWYGESYAEDVFVGGGSYTEATVGKISSLNPLFATTSSEKTLSRLMFATITADDYSGHPGLALADYVRADENGRIWKVRLRDGLKWSDGEPLTNEDVLFTTQLIQSPQVNTIYESNLTNVQVSENESGEIVFTLPSEYADFISALNFPVLPKHVLKDAPLKTLVEDEFSNTPVTSGAFSFNATQASTNEAEKIVYLAANPNYYLGKPMLNSFAVHSYDTKDDVINAINAGTVTATAELSGINAERVVSGQFNKQDSSINSGVFVFFNTSAGVFRNADLRRAVREGINITELREMAPGTIALNYPLTTSQIAIVNYPQIPAENFDDAKLKVANIASGNRLSVNIATVNSGYLPAVAGKLAEQLRALGFDVGVSAYEETQEFITNTVSRRSYDILVYEVELGADPDPLPYYHSSQANAAGLNLSNYRNPMVDDLLIGARETLDDTLRAKKYETFLEHWVNDVPAIGLYQANMTYIYNKNVRAYGNDVRLVSPIDRFVDVDTWATVKEGKNKTP